MDGEIRICMVGSKPSVQGGMSSVVKQLLGHTWNQQIKIQYISTHESGSPGKRCRIFLKGIAALLGCLISKEQVDVVHIHMSYKGSFYRKYMVHRLTKHFGKKDVIHLHGSEFEKFYEDASLRTKKKICRLFSECDQVLVLGNNWKELVVSIAPQAKVLILPNAVPIPKQQTCWSENPKLLYLGVLIPRKGVEDLLEAFIRLQEKELGKKLQLLVAGTGVLEDSLRKKVRDLKLEDQVIFCGWVDGKKKEQLLLNSQCLVLPSYYEGLPVALLEAMSYGLPVISTPVGSIEDAVVSGKNGYLVSPGQREALAKAIESTVSDSMHWKQLSEQARKTVIENYNEEQYFKEIEQIYRKLKNQY